MLRKPVAALMARRNLRKLVWEPLEPHLEGVVDRARLTRWRARLCPADRTAGEKMGSYLIEDYTFAVVPVPRMLGTAETKPGETPPQSIPTLLLVGDVEYGGAAGKADPQAVSRTAAVHRPRGTVRGVHAPPLDRRRDRRHRALLPPPLSRR